jgi:hypothetical protein
MRPAGDVDIAIAGLNADMPAQGVSDRPAPAGF